MFREDHPQAVCDDEIRNFPERIAVSIWINESYRERLAVLLDVEDCFLAWSADAFDKPTLINIEVFKRVFPLKIRPSLSKEDLIHEIK